MRVLFLTYPWIGLNQGGLQFQIRHTEKSLTKIGIEIEYFDPWCDKIDHIDICHFFALDQSLLPFAKRLKERRKPYVCSPVFNKFKLSLRKEKIKKTLSTFVPGLLNYYQFYDSILRGAGKIFPLNLEEKTHLSGLFDISDDKFKIIPNGIDKTFQRSNPQLAIDKFGCKDFVLEVGSIGPRKNQLTLIRAMKNLPYKLVLVGPFETGCVGYIESCKREAGENIIFAGSIHNTDPLLASCYSAAKLFVLPSFSEVMPLTLYEAAQAGCQLIASYNFPIDHTIEEYVSRIQPNDVVGLSKLIGEKMNQKTIPVLKSLASQMPTWDDVAYSINEEYKKLIG